MTGTSHTVTSIPLRAALLAALIISAPAMAAGPAAPAKTGKPKPCAEGQVEIVSKITGFTRCAAIGGITIMGGGPQPILIPEKPARKPKK